jgi:hypothetical protein
MAGDRAPGAKGVSAGPAPSIAPAGRVGDRSAVDQQTDVQPGSPVSTLELLGCYGQAGLQT